MTLAQKLMAIFQKLNYVEKAKEKSLTAQDWASINEAYFKEYGVKLEDDQAAEAGAAERAKQAKEANDKLAADNALALELINSVLGDNNQGSGGQEGNTTGGSGLIASVTTLIGKVTEMTSQTLPDNSVGVSTGKLSVNGSGTTEAYFLGIPHSMFSMETRWNRIAANPSIATVEPVNEKVDGSKFRAALESYSQSVAARINLLKENHALNPKDLISGMSVGLGGNAGLGDQFVTFRTDQLIARLLSVKNIYDIFPRRFGIQDREIITNAFFGDYSQAYQSGTVYKGSVDLKPEVAYVDDSMMKVLFESMKSIERQYIGYLNKEGSDPVKWSMIEWVMLNISTKLITEQNERKMFGIFVKPEPNKPGHSLNAGTGVFHTLLRYYNEAKIALCDSAGYASYNSGSTMVGVVNAMASELAAKVDGFDGAYECILNANHRAMWISGLRTTYGTHNDFTGADVDRIPDTNIPIRWCPYMKTATLIIFQKPGNIQALENMPGEMHNVGFDTDMENVKVWSVWKEGTSAEYAGRVFSSKAECAANDFAEQEIFMNKPVVTLAADATTATVNGDIRIFMTGANTAATTLTDIVGAKLGVAYMLEIGSASNPTKIAKAGKFSNLTAAFTPTTVGDYLMVVMNAEKTSFIELERSVGGVRTINTATQPNVVGGR